MRRSFLGLLTGVVVLAFAASAQAELVYFLRRSTTIQTVPPTPTVPVMELVTTIRRVIIRLPGTALPHRLA